MPYIDVLVHPAVTSSQAAELAAGVTDAMERVMGKRREVTAVRVAPAGAALWTIGGTEPAEPTAYVDVKITAGTNTPEQKAALLRRLHELLRATLGGLAEASYVVIHELPAGSWGYAGTSQAVRFGVAP
jgi:4-oxalocrotonate tautomerase